MKRLALRRPPALALDFLHPGAAPRRLGWQLLLLACSVPVLALAGLRYERLLATEHARDARLAQTLRQAFTQQKKASTAPGDLRLQGAALAEFRTVQAQLEYPWWSFLSFLESRQQADVALLALDPDRRTGTTRITAEAKDVAAMMNYLALLQQSGAFEQVVLASHQLELKRAGTPVRFELQGAWRRDFRWSPLPVEATPGAASPAASPHTRPPAGAKPIAQASAPRTPSVLVARDAQ